MNQAAELDLATGAFGNIGQAIAELLIARGRRVRTLTTQTPPDGSVVDAVPFEFEHPERLAAAFDGVHTFYNSYWMRTGDASGYANAVARSSALFHAAAEAGVQRIVHISVLHADRGSRYPYFRAKAHVEELLRRTGVPHAVIRPALVFGGRSALLDQLARVLRRSPLFPIAGDGRYRVRPVHIGDVARLCVETTPTHDGDPIDAVGPERPTFGDLVGDVKAAVGSRSRLVRAPSRLVVLGAEAFGAVTRQQLLTRDELLSTMDGLADSIGPPTGRELLSEWILRHGHELGRS